MKINVNLRFFPPFFLHVTAVLLFTTMLAHAQDKGGADHASDPPNEQSERSQEAQEAQEEGGPALDPKALELRVSERVNVIGDVGRVDELPGSAYFIDAHELEIQKQGFDDVQRMLRQVPGVVIQEEEGYGLRPNIGLRGSGTERSAKITLMEDGVLIAPAPYAAPAAYYFPVAGRMQSIEVRKGSSQVKFGPRTNGGALNLISTQVPNNFRLGVIATFGADDMRKVVARLGDAYENFGWNFETYQIGTSGFKQLDGGGGTGFNIGDYVGKLRFHTSPRARLFQEVEVKLGYTDQDSNETYLGITDGDFAATPLRRYAATELDHIQTEHELYQVRHFLASPAGFDVTTVAYRTNFARNWYKLQSIHGTGIADLFVDEDSFARELAIARGADSDADALRVRANNRSYFARGVQSTLGLGFGSGVVHDIEIGFRYHQDQEDRFQHEDGYQMLSGRMHLTSQDAPGSQTNRVSDADAFALFVQDEICFEKLTLVPGLRYETIDFLRTDYSGTDADRLSPTHERRNSVEAFIPGVGLTYDWSPGLKIFGGIHRGFSPPGPGANELTEPEKSVNYEIGLRGNGSHFRIEAVFFYNDYSNLLGADTLSAGGSGEGDLFNGGEARSTGIELFASIDLGTHFESGFAVPVQMSYTLTDAVFQSSFESEFEPWGSVEAGDGLPYLPGHQLYASVAVEDTRGLAGVNAVYTSAMRTRAGQGPIPEQEATDAFFVVNAFGELSLSGSARLFVNVQNVADCTYVVARAPAGSRPGLPRTLMAGIKIQLGS